MTNLSRDLPHFPIRQYAGLIPALEKHQVTTTDLLTLDVADLCKRTQLPLLDLKRLCNAVLEALHSDLGVSDAAKGGQPAQAIATDDGGDEVDKGTGSRQQPSTPSLAPIPQPQWSTISTLDPALDATLNGGIPTGYITEIAGEAGAGKTQFLLSLLLAVQLPPPHGIGRRALYISTEAPLSTRRLTQMLTNNPLLTSLPPKTPKPSLDNIISTTTPDLESQEHILTYQVPVEVERRNIGLIVLDSVAANYRAEFDRGTGASATKSAASQSSNMGARSAELVRLGMLLRDLAKKHNLAVVVSNQVADRFRSSSVGSPLLSSSLSKSQLQPPPSSTRPSDRNLATPTVQRVKAGRAGAVIDDSPLAARSNKNSLPPLPPIEPTSSVPDGLLPQSSISVPQEDNKGGAAGGQEDIDEDEPPPTRPPPPPPDDLDLPFFPAPAALLFDHQQRWFTGWGDDPGQGSLKTPSLGLVWATQLACRIVLFKAPRYGRSRYAGDEDDAGGHATIKTWRRWAKVVFASHVAGAGPGLEGASEFEINMGGVKSVVRDRKDKR